MHITNRNNVVFSVYPNATGFGFVYLDSFRRLIDFGVVRIHPISNYKIMERIKKSMSYFKPSTVIVQDPECNSSRAGSRVRNLIDQIITYAQEEHLPIKQYSRDKVKEVFEIAGATTKYEISQALLQEFKELEMKMPKKRKVWASEDPNMAIFDALSLAVAWFYLNG